MRKVKIITDSCADLNEKQLKEYNIDYVKMSIIEDEKESPALLTWSADDAHKMFRNMQLCIPWNI